MHALATTGGSTTSMSVIPGHSTTSVDLPGSLTANSSIYSDSYATLETSTDAMFRGGGKKSTRPAFKKNGWMQNAHGSKSPMKSTAKSSSSGIISTICSFDFFLL